MAVLGQVRDDRAGGEAATPAAEAAHLLVVDDDARLRGLLQRFLAEQGFRVSGAADAAAPSMSALRSSPSTPTAPSR